MLEFILCIVLIHAMIALFFVDTYTVINIIEWWRERRDEYRTKKEAHSSQRRQTKEE